MKTLLIGTFYSALFLGVPVTSISMIAAGLINPIIGIIMALSPFIYGAVKF